MLEQTLPRVRELDSLATPIEQMTVELSFERFDSHTGGCRRDERALRALGEAWCLGNVNEKAQVSEIEVHRRCGLS
jgi:hypothetical protein